MKLNNAKQQKILQEYFVRMMMPEIQKLALPFELEEEKELSILLRSIKKNNNNFVVVGAGTLFYIELALKLNFKYIAVEPLIDLFVQKQVKFLLNQNKKIKLINKDFGNFSKSELPAKNTVFAFIFNILGYIKNPLAKINKYLKAGDIIFICSWNNENPKARKVRKEYFKTLNNTNQKQNLIIYNNKTIGICNLNAFPFNKLSSYKRHIRLKGEITDILIIYC